MYIILFICFYDYNKFFNKDLIGLKVFFFVNIIVLYFKEMLVEYIRLEILK